jgi:KRAB domain-containing zinc finger protein
MIAHMKTHFETKTFRCPHCDRKFKWKKSLMEHISSKHNNEKQSHSGEHGFICDQFEKSFATMQDLGHHRSKHIGDYQYRCHGCDKGFNNYKLMDEHFHIHTGDKPYQCNKCDKGFANRGCLWIHQKQHSSDCSKGFSDIQSPADEATAEAVEDDKMKEKARLN